MEARTWPSYAHLERPAEEARTRRTSRWRVLVSSCGLVAAGALGLSAVSWRNHETAKGLRTTELMDFAESKHCSAKFVKPEKPTTATALNGVKLDDVCIENKPPYHVFIIGDWGGFVKDGTLAAVSHLNHRWNQSFKFVYPADANCQFLVRDQMVKRAPKTKPAYVLNVGDNFYWGGVYDSCGAKDFNKMYANGGSKEHETEAVDQFKQIFEDIYNGPGIDGLMWLGVLGNHDWGGWRMDMAWDQAIGYTWSEAKTAKDRWMTPALYYYVTVKYHDFSVDYYFMDTNVWDALDWDERPPHNICGPHNPSEANCSSSGGPSERGDKCVEWFHDLWDEQKQWLKRIVPKSKAEWRMVVTHFPPYWGKDDWMEMAPEHELDVIITGHRHSQNMHGPTDEPARIWPEDQSNKEMNDFLDPTAWIVSGGGGGITSEHVPDPAGNDDQYGFVDMELSKEKLSFELISHGGQIRRKLVLEHHYSHGGLNKVVKKAKKHAKKEEGHGKDGHGKDGHGKDGHGDHKGHDHKGAAPHMATYFFTLAPAAEPAEAARAPRPGQTGTARQTLKTTRKGRRPPREDDDTSDEEVTALSGESLLTGVHPDVYGACMLLSVRGFFDGKIGGVVVAWLWVLLTIAGNLMCIWTLHEFATRSSAVDYGSQSAVEKIIERLRKCMDDNIMPDKTSSMVDAALVALCEHQPSTAFFFAVHFIWSARMLGQLSEARTLLFCIICCPVKDRREQTIDEGEDNIVLTGLMRHESWVFILTLVLPKTVMAMLLWYVGAEFLNVTRDVGHLLFKAVTLYYLSTLEMEMFNNFVSQSKKEWVTTAQLLQVRGNCAHVALSWPGEVVKLLSAALVVVISRLVWTLESRVRHLCYTCVHTCPNKCSEAFSYCHKLDTWPYHYKPR